MALETTDQMFGNYFQYLRIWTSFRSIHKAKWVKFIAVPLRKSAPAIGDSFDIWYQVWREDTSCLVERCALSSAPDCCVWKNAHHLVYLRLRAHGTQILEYF